MNVKALTCPNCGGAIHKYQNFCEYCGSGLDWKEDNPIIRVETFQNLLAWLAERNYLNASSLEYDYDEHSYIDVIPLVPEEVYEEYVDWLEIEDN